MDLYFWNADSKTLYVGVIANKIIDFIISYPIHYSQSCHDCCKVFDEAENLFVRLEVEQILCNTPDVCIYTVLLSVHARPRRKKPPE